MFCSDRCVSFDAPLISDQGSRAYRCITSGGWRDRHREQGQHGVCSFCVMWCRRACVASFVEVSNGGSQDHNWECD